MGFVGGGSLPGPQPRPPPSHLPWAAVAPPRPAPLTLCQVNAAAIGHAQRLAAGGHFAGFSAVLTSVLAAYGAPDWTHLAVAPSPLDTPCLAYLWKLDQQVGSVVACFAGLRGIATLADLDAEVAAVLRSMCIPTLFEVAGQSGDRAEGTANPEEIELPDDDSDGSNCGNPEEEGEGGCRQKGFGAFGVGPLLAHPAVQHYFQPSRQLMEAGITACSVSAADIYPHLATFLQQNQPNASSWPLLQGMVGAGVGHKRYRAPRDSTEPPGANVSAFIEHLMHALDVTDLREVGVRISPAGLAAEAQVMRAVAAAQESALVEEKKRALARLSQEEADRRRSAAAEAKERAAPQTVTLAAGKVPKLKPPVHKRVAGFLSACESDLQGPWRPTFAKMRAVVGKRLQSKQSISADEELLDVATEYAMLHLGGSRNVLKRLDLMGSADDDEPSAEASAGASPSEDNSGDDRDSSSSESSGNEASSSSSGGTGSGRKNLSSDDSRPGKRSKQENAADEEVNTVGRVEAGHGGATTKVTVHDGLPRREDRSRPFEDTRRPPLQAEPPLAVSGRQLQACLPWHQSLNRQDPRAIGRWGEALAYHYLLSQYPGWGVKWLNRDEETRASYDIELTRPGQAHHETIFVEVKTTVHSRRNVFELTLWEWEFAAKSRHQYAILRVYGAGSPTDAGIHILHNPYEAVQQHKMGLCLVY